MQYREIELGEILKDIDFRYPSTQFIPDIDIQLKVTDQETDQAHTITLASKEWVIKELLYKYGNFKFLYPFKEESHDVDTERVKLEYVFKQFLSTCSLVNYSRIYESLTYKYNPIENYDKYSEIRVSYVGSERNTTGESGSEKNTLEMLGGDTSTIKYDGTTTSRFTTPTEGYQDDEITYKSPEETTGYQATQKISNKLAHRDESNTTSFSDRNDETIRTFDNRMDVNTREFDDRLTTVEKSYNNRSDSTEEHTHGNIGVSTPMDMALKEIETRKFDLQKYIIHQFIMEYCVL